MSVTKRNKKLSAFTAKAQVSVEYWAEAAVMAFTEELTQAMEREQITRAELAQRVGVSAAFVTKVLRGNVNLTLETINKFSLALGMTARIHIAPKDLITRWVDVPSIAGNIASQAAGHRKSPLKTDSRRVGRSSPKVGSRVSHRHP